jgi:hypothetical protein
MISASSNRCSKDIGIEPIIVAELNSAAYRGIYFDDILWNVPTTPRLKFDEKPSIVLV